MGVVIELSNIGRSRCGYPSMDTTQRNRESEINEILRKHEAFIRALAVSFTRADVDDLIQEGRIALLQAVRLYDPTRGAQLWTYARRTVRGAMLDFIAKFEKEIDALDEGSIDLDTLPCGECGADERLEQRERLVGLSDRDNELVFKRFGEGKSYRAIAVETGRNVERVHTAVKEAVETLKGRAA